MDYRSGAPASDLDFRRNTRVVSDTDVIGYFNAQGPMLRLDAASGEELLAYDDGLHLEYGEYLGGGKEFGARTKKLLVPSIKIRPGLVKDDAVIQVYNNEIVRLDRETGKRQWHRQQPKA